MAIVPTSVNQGADNLGTALGLNNKDSAGWDMLASFRGRSDGLSLT